MTLTRRTVLKQLGLLTGGIMLLPGCVRPARQVSVSLHNITVTGDQEAVLADLVDTIIPAGEIPGAKALNVHQFVLHMVDDCQAPANQKIFLDGFADLDGRSKKQFDNDFSSLTTGQKIALLDGMEKEFQNVTGTGKKSDPPPTFLSLTKRYTVQGYLQSEYVMTNVTGYNMIPGRFDGCIPMDTNKKPVAV